MSEGGLMRERESRRKSTVVKVRVEQIAEISKSQGRNNVDEQVLSF